MNHANINHRKVGKPLSAAPLLQSLSLSTSCVDVQTSAQQRVADLVRQLAAARCHSCELSKR